MRLFGGGGGGGGGGCVDRLPRNASNTAAAWAERRSARAAAEAAERAAAVARGAADGRLSDEEVGVVPGAVVNNGDGTYAVTYTVSDLMVGDLAVDIAASPSDLESSSAGASGGALTPFQWGKRARGGTQHTSGAPPAYPAQCSKLIWVRPGGSIFCCRAPRWARMVRQGLGLDDVHMPRA